MKRWIKRVVAAFSRGFASTIHYLYLARIPFLGWVTLLALPLLARHAGRPLILGAYDLSSNLQGFSVGVTYGLAGGSIYFAGWLITSLSSKRFRLCTKPLVQRRIEKAWGVAIFLVLLLNILTVIQSSEPAPSKSVQLGVAMAAGVLLAIGGAYLGGFVSVRVPSNAVYRSFVWLGMKVGLGKQEGYLYQDPATREWEYQNGQIRAVSYAFIVIIAYLIFTARAIPALVTLTLLISLGVLVLTGVTFFWDRYRLPLLAILVVYFWLMGFCPKADHYYRVGSRPESNPELVPSEVVGRAAQQHVPIVVVAAAGGGIQSAAWTTSVLDQLGKRLSAEPGGGYDLPHSVRLISGVSGGSVGAMFYAGTFDEAKPDFADSFTAASSSALGPTIRGLLRQDLWRALAPFFVTDICDDRGRILEREWCRNFDEKFRPSAKLSDATLSKWGEEALTLKRPALVLNSTIVETGQRLAISTVPMRSGLIGETEFTKRYCADISISTAARLSATFPFITPTGRPAMQRQAADKMSMSERSSPPCGGGDQHVVDGGYYENSGLVGAIEWMDEALTDLKNQDRNPKGYPLPRNILLLVISGFEKPSDPEDSCMVPSAHGEPPDVAHGVLYNLASPIDTVMNVRGSGQQSFARRMLRMFQKRWALENVNIHDAKIFFEVNNPSNRDEAVPAEQKAQALAGKQPAGPFYTGIDPGKEPLSWHLRPVEINELKKEWIGFSDTKCPDGSYQSDSYQSIVAFFEGEAGAR